ncbi:hypothetical protein [Streptomyces atratus]|uniref:hypothetical protein n=1 Tax=Streptomyces atratus TaxID=1893 RepID=UPI0021A4444E|nr:hypothetical protein [Streptomyces atratus]MCT2546868.1 hypothetical protein [Streptomyces atratus]
MNNPDQLPDCGFAPDGPLDVYATSITEVDVAAVETLLAARLSEVDARCRPTAPKTRVAQSLYETAGYQLDLLKDAVTASRPETLKEWLELWNGLVHSTEQPTPG